MMMGDYDCETPYLKGLGGTQSAIVYYAESLAKMGHVVDLFTQGCQVARESRGVSVRSLTAIDKSFKTDVAIWCSGVLETPGIYSQISARLVVCWIPHSTNEPGVVGLKKQMYSIDYFLFVSDAQRKKFVTEFGLPIEKTMLMLNGISPAFQAPVDMTAKKPRIIYSSQPDRGLVTYLQSWPLIVDKHPDAELHLYGSRKTHGL
jgi:glycosyltransferase involved in cell wall biosynthesis